MLPLGARFLFSPLNVIFCFQFQASDPNTIEYHGFVRVHMHVQRPIHVSTAITRTSWYRLMRPVKERTLNDVDGYEVGPHSY